MLGKEIRQFVKVYLGSSYATTVYAVIFSIFHSLLLIPSVFLINLMFDENIPEKDFYGLLFNSSLIILLNIVQALLSIIYRNSFIKIVKKAVRALQMNLINKLIGANYGSTHHLKNTELINRGVDDIVRIDKMLDGILSIVIPQFILFTVGLGIMFYYNPIIGGSTVVLGGIGIVIQKFFRKKVLSHIRSYVSTLDKVSGFIDSLLNKQLLIKMRNNEDEEVEKALSLTMQMSTDGVKTAKSGYNVTVVNELIINISATILIVMGSALILLDLATFGNVFGLYFLIVFIRKTVTQLANQVLNINEGTIALEKINKLMRELNSQIFDKSTVERKLFDGAIEFESVSFGYNRNERILTNVNFQIKKGETVLISGKNGSGKSTLINLLLGFCKADSGKIYADHIDYSIMNLPQMRKRIGYVPQKQHLIDGTLQENLLYGVKEIDVNAVEKLLKSELYKQLIGDLTLDYSINASYHNLSGGQIQKIAIMRALIIQPSLLILDEPTNHLDYQTISQLIDIIKKERSVGILIVSHHQIFENITDRKYVLKEGILKEIV